MNRLLRGTSVAWIVFFHAVALSAEFGRLDPHGTAQMNLKKTLLKTHTECRVCHADAGGRLSVKPGVRETCISCHARLPHSGVAEHAKHGKVSCLDCHSPHRAGSKNPVAQASILKQELLPPGEGLIRKLHPHPMLRKTCIECHTQKNWD